MKKKMMKLQLNRETLRHMAERDLKEVGGASARRCSDYPCITDGDSCDCSLPTWFC